MTDRTTTDAAVERYVFAEERKHWTQRDLGQERRDLAEEMRDLWKYLDGEGVYRGDDADNTIVQQAIAYCEDLKRDALEAEAALTSKPAAAAAAVEAVALLVEDCLSRHGVPVGRFMGTKDDAEAIIAALSKHTEPAQSEGEDEETYRIGKRDGYEQAIQELDLATGGDGEFVGSTIPGRTVDLPVMKARIIERLAPRAAEPGQSDGEDIYSDALRLAQAIYERHYRDKSRNWKPLPDLRGVISQIDNMTAGLSEQVQSQATDLARLETQLAKAREALEPFAQAATVCVYENYTAALERARTVWQEISDPTGEGA